MNILFYASSWGIKFQILSKESLFISSPDIVLFVYNDDQNPVKYIDYTMDQGTGIMFLCWTTKTLTPLPCIKFLDKKTVF